MPRLLVVFVAFFLSACDPDPVTLTFSGETMGTTYSITAIDQTGKLDAGDIEEAIAATLAKVNGQMSNWDPNSEISRYNANPSTDPVDISPELATVMKAAMDVHEASLGQFDVTLGPLIEVWGFGPRTPESPIPSDEAIADALNIVGQSKILAVTDTTMAKTLPDTTVWLAAIAKGYGVDELAATLSGFGLEDFLVEIGGDLYATGKNADGDAWKIGIERPDAADRTIEEIVSVTGYGLATSGDYRNYFEQDGVRYSHIIDAETGRPIDHKTASVTVLAENAMLADAWATAFLALGEERGLEISQALDLPVFFIVRDGTSTDLSFTTVATDAFKELQGE